MSRSRPGGGRDPRAVLTIVALGVLPVVLLGLALAHWRANDTLAWDFHHELYPQAETMLDGDNPYPSSAHDPATGTNQVWPPAAALVIAPLTLLPPAAADLVIALLGLVCFAAALWVVGVRDWRVYGVVGLWPPVFIEPGLAHLTPLVSLLVALAWRTRDASSRSGLVVGFAVAVKLFVWPLLVWLAATRRLRTACLGVLVAATSLVLVLPFTGLGSYVESVLRVGRAFDQDTYTVYGLLVQSGASELAARIVTVVAAGTLLWGTWRYQSFTLAIATALVASPIVWLDYFAIAAIPLAILRPRLSPIWFVPLLTIGLGGAGLELGDALGTFRALAAFGVVLVVAFREERLAYAGREPSPTSRGTPRSTGVSASPTSAARGPT